jgi:hypothetical protein
MNFLGGCQTIKLAKIIADTKWINYAYPRRFMNVKPKNPKEVNHENLSSRKNLDRLPLYQFSDDLFQYYSINRNFYRKKRSLF